MQVRIDNEALDSLLAHAASAARLVGHLDADNTRVSALGDHVDAIVHELTELRGAPCCSAGIAPESLVPSVMIEASSAAGVR